MPFSDYCVMFGMIKDKQKVNVIVTLVFKVCLLRLLFSTLILYEPIIGIVKLHIRNKSFLYHINIPSYSKENSCTFVTLNIINN